MAPGAMGPPRHFHPAQEESWRVVQGELSVQVENGWRSIAAGETRSIPPGTVHTLGNRSNDTVRFHDTHVPALDFQHYIEDLDRLAASGCLTSRMTPRTLIYGSMALTDHRPMQLSASRVQRAIESLLAIIGRRLGYRLPVTPSRAGESRARDEGGADRFARGLPLRAPPPAAARTCRARQDALPLRHQLTLYAIDIVVPIALYYLLRGVGVSNLLALIAGAAVPACSALVTLRITGRLDAVSVLVLASFVVSIIASLVAHNPRFLLAKEGLITGAWGVWFLASLAARRPAAFVFARPLMEGRRMFAADGWDVLWQSEPRFRRIWQISSVIWGGALLVDAALRVAMSYSLPVHTVPALGGLLWPVTFVVIQVVTNIYYHRAGLYRILGARWLANPSAT